MDKPKKWRTFLMQTWSVLGLYFVITVWWEMTEMALYGVSQQSIIDSAAALCIAYLIVSKIWRTL